MAEKPEDLLARAIYGITVKKLECSPSAMFEFLFARGYFASAQATTAFIRALTKLFDLTEGQAQIGFQKAMISKLYTLDRGKYPTPLAIFNYVDSIGFFFGNIKERALFLHEAENKFA